MQSACAVSCSIRANDLGGGCPYMYGANRAGNRARTLHSYISVTDKVKINEQKIQ